MNENTRSPSTKPSTDYLTIDDQSLIPSLARVERDDNTTLSTVHHFGAIKCVFHLLTVSARKSVYCYSSCGLHSYAHTSNDKNFGPSLQKKKKRKPKEPSRASVPYIFPTSPSSSGPPATWISCTLSQATPLKMLAGPSATTASSSAGLSTSKNPAKPSVLAPSCSPDKASTCASCRRGKTYMCPSVSSTSYDGAPGG